MSTRYFAIAKDGQTVFGPFTLPEIAALQERGALVATSQICREGTEQWAPLTTYADLMPANPQKTARPARSEEVSPRLFFGMILGALVAVAVLAWAAYHPGSASWQFFGELLGESHSERPHSFTVIVDGTSGTIFDGLYGIDGQSTSVTGSVPRRYVGSGKACVAVMQKKGGTGTLDVTIERDGDVVSNKVTSAEFGIVSVSGR